MLTTYDLNKIKFSTDSATFKRAIELYNKEKVTKVAKIGNNYKAEVLGTSPYFVSISLHDFTYGNCSCYLGRRDILCKHMVALAIYAVEQGQPLKDESKKDSNKTLCSRQLGCLDKESLAALKKSITDAMRYVKAYCGPSRTWFANQHSLEEGCHRLRVVVSDLPISKQTADLLVKLLLRLDRKLLNGVDDSNGIVGGFMSELVELLETFVEIDSDCVKAFKQLCGKGTCFGWEEALVRIWDERER